MAIKLNKDSLHNIEVAFIELLTKSGKDGCGVIAKNLKDCLDYEFDVSIVKNSKSFFGMSIFPEVSTMDKIVEVILNNEDNKDAVKTLWESNKKWYIEFDSNVLDGSFTNKELTAMLLHEVGHLVCSNSIPSRISLIVKYEIIKAQASTKMMLKDKIFRAIMSLPIIDACVTNKKSTNDLKEEIKADTFAKKMGYTSDLYSALTKMSKKINASTSAGMKAKMAEMSEKSLKMLEDFQARKDKLAKSHLISIKESTDSPYINSFIDTQLYNLFECDEDSMIIQHLTKSEVMAERADRDIEDGYVLEFFNLGGKELKSIKFDMDYIAIKIEDMKNNDDRIMIVGYIHSKLDLVRYYIEIMKDPKLSKKYNIKYTVPELLSIEKRLETLLDTALRHKIPEKSNELLIKWPSGYEG